MWKNSQFKWYKNWWQIGELPKSNHQSVSKTNSSRDKIVTNDLLKPYSEYGIKTPVVCASKYAKNNNLYVKLEHLNIYGSIKSRTAYFMLRGLLSKGKVENLVESSSGNLGLCLGCFAKKINKNFLCLVDPTVPIEKLKNLKDNGINYQIIQLSNFPDYRTARIYFAKLLNEKEDWIWTNQYDSQFNYQAHYETTGPEIYEQLNGKIDYLVCAVGTGGTICGTGSYLKEHIKGIKIVAVEPIGSTIFGGAPSKYLTAGSGLSYPSGIVKRYYNVLDYYTKIDDAFSIYECLEFNRLENLMLGITTGSVLCAGKKLSSLYPDKIILCISPDSGDAYSDSIHNFKRPKPSNNIEIRKVRHGNDILE